MTVSHVSSFADSVLKFSTGIDIFIEILRYFDIFRNISDISVDSPVQCNSEKQILCKIFAYDIYWNDFLSDAPLCAHQGICI